MSESQKNRIFSLQENQKSKDRIEMSTDSKSGSRFPWSFITLVIIVLAGVTFGGIYYLKELKTGSEGKSKFENFPESDISSDWAEKPDAIDLPDDPELLAAIKLYKQHYIDSARNRFSDILQTNKDAKIKSYALLYLGILAEEQTHFDMAQEFYNKAQKYYPKNFFAYYNNARLFKKKGKPNEALSQVELALQIKPDSSRALILKADLQYSEGDTKAAQDTLEDIENDSLANYNKGLYYKREGNFAEARISFLRALDAPGPPESRHKSAAELGILFGQQGDYGNSEIYFKRAIELYPRSAKYYYNLAYVQSLHNKKAEAMANLEKSLSYGAEKSSTYRYIARLYEDLGDINGAEKSLRKALENSPRNTEILSALSKVLISRSNWNDAMFYLQKTIDLSTGKLEKANAYYNLGRVYYEIGNYKDATYALEKAYALDSKNTEFITLLGKVYAEAGHPHKSIHLYKKELSDNPDNIDLKLALGNLYYTEGLYMQAEQEYEGVVSQDEADSKIKYMALFNLGKIYQNQKLYDKAIALFGRAEKKADANQQYNILLAITETKLAADYPGSSTFEDLQKAISLRQPAFRARYLLARAYLKDGSMQSIESAEEELTAIVEMADDPVLLSKCFTLRGTIYYKQGFANKAITDFNLALEHDPSNSTAFQNKQAAENMIESNY
ncbi:MAG: tetratricopeptide repeat protein [Leptospirales bacterium]